MNQEFHIVPHKRERKSKKKQTLQRETNPKTIQNNVTVTPQGSLF